MEVTEVRPVSAVAGEMTRETTRESVPDMQTQLNQVVKLLQDQRVRILNLDVCLNIF
jgi:hypothetical protein